MTESGTHASNLDLIGGALCLDFANTADDHASDQPYEWLTSYEDLVAWSRHVAIVSDEQAAALLEFGAQHPEEAARIHHRAVELRDTIFRIFMAIAEGQTVPADDLEQLNAALAAALSHSRLVPSGDGYAWSWTEALDPGRVLWPVLRSTADLLTSARLERIRSCANSTCGWLFLDTSRSGRRRWCSMDACGNRAKARRHYQRQRASSESPS